MDVLSKPLTAEEINERKNEDNYIEAIIAVDLSDAIDNDLEGFLDLISEKLVDSPLLMNINYSVVGIVNESILLKVSGDASGIVDED